MIRNFHQSKRKKIRPPIGNLDPEIMKEFDKQVSDNLEIENRRKKTIEKFLDDCIFFWNDYNRRNCCTSVFC